jgi:hypothetical protein
MNSTHFRAHAVALLLALSSVARADLSAELAACAAIQNDPARLACYDAAVAPQSRQTEQPQRPSAQTVDALAAPVQAPPPPPATVPPPATAAAAKSPEDQFGEASVRANTEAAKKAKQPKLSEITARIVEIGYKARGELVVTLDNGQVWVQKDSSSRFPIKAGDEVTIRARSLGSFRMVGPTGRSIQVTRVR